MTQHLLQGRTEAEVLWFQRRSFLQAAAAWTATGGFASAQAQQRTNIVELRGDALLNGGKLSPQQTIQTGDSLETFWGEAEARNGRFLTPAKAINHTDEELEYLAKLVNQRTAWQIAGKKGVLDGSGYMDPKPGETHPLMK